MSDFSYFIRPVQPEDVVSFDSKILSKKDENRSVAFLAYSGTAHLRVGTIQSFHRRLRSLIHCGGVVGCLRESTTSSGGNSRTGERTLSEIRERSAAFHNGNPPTDQKAYF
jgi:hypothetical protein